MADDSGLTEESAKRWQPVLEDGLRYLLKDTLRIELDHVISALPARSGVMVVTPEPAAELAAPYNLLSPRTLMELVSPGEWATWRGLRKLYVDGALYSLDQDIERLSDIGLWLLASRMSPKFLDHAREELGPLEVVGPGLYRASFCGCQVVLVHLHELSLSVAAIPLLMVYCGPREEEIARFVFLQGQDYRLFTEQVFSFHPHAVKEVMAMLGMTPEAFRRLANAKDVLDLFGPQIVIEEMGKEKLIRAIGEEEFIRTIGEEEIIRTIGPDRIRELLDQMAKEREASSPGQP